MSQFGPSTRIGVLGGGQLGRMMIQEAVDLDARVEVMDPSAEAPCRYLTHRFVQGDLCDAAAVEAFGAGLDCLTIEIENVSTEGMEALERRGVRVVPKPAHVRVLCSQGGVPISPPKGSAYACDATYDVAVVDTTAAPASSDDNTAVIVGACAGGGALFLTLVAGLLFRARRRTRLPKAASSAPVASSTCA